jgi:hypothetical protein
MNFCFRIFAFKGKLQSYCTSGVTSPRTHWGARATDMPNLEQDFCLSQIQIACLSSIQRLRVDVTEKRVIKTREPTGGPSLSWPRRSRARRAPSTTPEATEMAHRPSVRPLLAYNCLWLCTVQGKHLTPKPSSVTLCVKPVRNPCQSPEGCNEAAGADEKIGWGARRWGKVPQSFTLVGFTAKISTPNHHKPGGPRHASPPHVASAHLSISFKYPKAPTYLAEFIDSLALREP